MGRAKEEQGRLDDLFMVAQDICVKTGAIKECPIHDGVYIDLMDGDAASHAYAMGTNMIKSGEIEADRQELMDAIKRAIEESGEECYSCEKHRDD